MRNLYIAATIAFWAVVLVFWVGSAWSPHAAHPTVDVADRAISLSELAKHASPDNCWMAIRGSVYDLTAYLPDHPSRPQIIEPWCGKDATEAYNNKTKGRPHSKEADGLLGKHRIGILIRSSQ